MYDDGSPASEDPPAGEVAFTIYTPVGGISPLLIYDPVTNTVTLSGVTVPTPTITPFGTAFTTSSGGILSTTPAAASSCPSVTYTCSQLFTCQEAYACLAAGNVSLDPDGDGVPCTCAAP
jgi:hypothetical protein